jgi:hypothetical protein
MKGRTKKQDNGGRSRGIQTSTQMGLKITERSDQDALVKPARAAE